MKPIKRVVCYSGGESSAKASVEVARAFGIENLVLLNHNIHASVEDADIKRFKQEVADYLGVPITYANMPQWDTMDQFDTVVKAQAFKVGTGTALCTARMKTEPFEDWLKENVPDKDDCVIYYGFDANETARIQRRSSVLASMGYRSDYPLALWKERTIHAISEIGIKPPMTYAVFKHGNCVGCLKAGKQHWYVVYCTRPDIWAKAKWAEDEIGYSILKGVYLEELEDDFETMNHAGVAATEHIAASKFWKLAQHAIDTARGATKRGQLLVMFDDNDTKPCECVF